MIQASPSNKIVCITTTCAFRGISGPQKFVGGALQVGRNVCVCVGGGFKCTRIPLDLFNIFASILFNQLFVLTAKGVWGMTPDSHAPVLSIHVKFEFEENCVGDVFPVFFNIIFHNDVNDILYIRSLVFYFA